MGERERNSHHVEVFSSYNTLRCYGHCHKEVRVSAFIEMFARQLIWASSVEKNYIPYIGKSSRMKNFIRRAVYRDACMPWLSDESPVQGVIPIIELFFYRDHFLYFVRILALSSTFHCRPYY